MRLRLVAAIVAALLGLSAPPAHAQCTGLFVPGGVCGNAATAKAFPVATTLGALFDADFGAPAPVGTVLNRTGSGWGATTGPLLGNAGVTSGSIGLANAVGGTVTLSAPAIAGNTAFTFPNNTGSSGFVLTTNGAGATQWSNPTSGGTVISVGLSLPTAVFSVTGSPVTVSGTFTVSLQNQSANAVFIGPVSGGAAPPTFRALLGGDLPLPTTGALGGVQAINAIASNWITSIDTNGVPHLSQPGYGDIAGNISQISGVLSPSQLPPLSANTILSNATAGTTFPTGNTLTALIDSAVSNVQGSVLYRNASAWVALPPGTSGQALETQGAAANPIWASVAGTGTVTNVATNNGITGGPITTSGTIGLATIATGNVLAYTSGGTGVPVATTPTAVLDVIGSTQGQVLYRGAGVWTALATGTSGQYLQTQGAGATPQWASISSNLTAGAGIAITGTTTATIANTALRNFIANLTLSNDGGSPNTVLDVAAGAAADSTNAAIITLGTFTKSTAGAWAAGSGSNGMGQGLTIANSTWYHVCLANNNGAPDIWFDTAAACTNRPAGIADTKFRRIGSFKTNGSAQIVAFIQAGNYFYILPVVESSLTATRPIAALTLAAVPTGVVIQPLLDMQAGANNPTGAINQSLSPVTQLTWVYFVTTALNGLSQLWQGIGPATNTSAQIGYATSIGSSGGTATLSTVGWIDRRGQF